MIALMKSQKIHKGITVAIYYAYTKRKDRSVLILRTYQAIFGEYFDILQAYFHVPA